MQRVAPWRRSRIVQQILLGRCICCVFCGVHRDETDETLGSTEALQAKLGTLSLEAQSKLEADTAAKEAKAERKADAALKKKLVCTNSSIASIIV